MLWSFLPCWELSKGPGQHPSEAAAKATGKTPGKSCSGSRGEKRMKGEAGIRALTKGRGMHSGSASFDS